jgi:hypothetical protein
MVHQPHDAERKVLHCAELAHQRLPSEERIMTQKQLAASV